MDNCLVSVNESTVEGIGRLARFFGFAEVMGRLYGTLLMSPEELSLDDLASQLEISKGSVSMNMRALERWGMAKEVWVRGERKKYYAAEHDLWQVIRNVLSSRERCATGQQSEQTSAQRIEIGAAVHGPAAEDFRGGVGQGGHQRGRVLDLHGLGVSEAAQQRVAIGIVGGE